MKKNLIKYGSIVSFVALLIVVLSAFVFRKSVTEVVLESHNFYQYLSGIKFDYTGNLKIKKGNEITELVFDDVKIQLDSTPIYYVDEKKVLLPETMSLIYPKTNVTQYKVSYFSSIYDLDSTIYLQNGNLKKVLNNCFLYDGRDLYFFIEETKIIVNGLEIIVSPMSYVVLTYNDNIQIYDYASKNFQKIDISNQEVIASAKGYQINLSIDAVIYNNKSRLLIKNPDYLKNIE